MEIQKNVSFPGKRTTAKKGQSKYKFKEMEVGDSFIIEDEGKRYSVSILARNYGQSCDPIKTFSVRRDKEKKLRCLRTE